MSGTEEGRLGNNTLDNVVTNRLLASILVKPKNCVSEGLIQGFKEKIETKAILKAKKMTPLMNVVIVY